MGCCSSKSVEIPVNTAPVTGIPANVQVYANPTVVRNVQPNPPKPNQKHVNEPKPPKKQAPPTLINYGLLNSIPDFHQPKKYKQPFQAVVEQPRVNFYYPQEYLAYNQDFSSNLYAGCDLSDPAYIATLPKKREGSTTVIDQSRTFFFSIGHSPVYSESTYVLIGFSGEDTVWADIEDPSYKVTRTIHMPQGIASVLGNWDIRKEFMQAGWIVTIEHKWGFLLNLESIAEAYQGHFPHRWSVLLREPYFIDIFEKFGSYFEEENSKKGQKGVIRREIPSTDFDTYLPEWHPTFNNRLFWRQRQEVGWMFRFENYPAVRLRKKFNAIPFLDTGYYLDPNNPTSFLGEDDDNGYMDVMMPGGVLASQIGSGKTVTAIALMTVGSQLKYGGGINGHVMPLNSLDPTVIELNYWLDGVYEPSLVIVTKNILGQWWEEFKKFAPHLRVCALENENDLKKLKAVKTGSEFKLVDFDVILTHRKMIENGAVIQEFCPKFFEITFRRVMIDEFHELTNMINQQCGGKSYVENDQVVENINMYNFCLNLKKIDRRFTWGITGTPDSLDYYNETTPLFKLLNLDEKYNNLNTFSKLKDEFVTTCFRKNPRSIDLPVLKKSIEKVYFGELQNILYQGKLNYAKNKNAAQEICSHLLPQWRELENTQSPLDIVIQTVHTKHQKEIMDIKIRLQKKPGDQALEGRLEVLMSEGNFFNDVIKLLSQKAFECPVCLVEKEADQMVVTECMHGICVECYGYLMLGSHVPHCPVCRESINKNNILIHPGFRDKKQNKLSAILNAINETPKGDKIIIFTQFHSLVEHLAEIFTRTGVQYTVLRGEPSDINISLNRFRYMPQLKVLLMSIEQAASGINVTMANHVFFAHPIFGMEFEKAALTYNQCIGRAYRIGQMKEVHVKLFVTSNSIEEDMVPSFNKYADTLN